MMPRARLLSAVLIGLYDDARPAVLAGARSRLREAWFPLRSRCAAAALLAALLTGCAGRESPSVPPAPVVLRPGTCPEPPLPALPPLDGAQFLDAPANVGALLARDDMTRQYINALRSALDCYAAQAKEP